MKALGGFRSIWYVLKKARQVGASASQSSQKVETVVHDMPKIGRNEIVEIKKLSTENKELYGSVKPSEISKIIENNEKIKINPSIIQPVKEIKSLGEFKVIINLHSEIQEKIIVKVLPQEENK